jgi:KUP system potassium uptake protein
MPLTLVILTACSAVQKRGTAGIGRFFGPITLVWFMVLAVLGVSHIVKPGGNPGGAQPAPCAGFHVQQPGHAFIILGAVVLCVTGAEALYADLGHFGKRPIRLAWFSLVMPALLLNYFGQGALLLAAPREHQEPVLRDGARLGAVPAGRLATMRHGDRVAGADHGAFSVTKQAIQLGYLPRLRIQHTSVRDTGQIYMPFVNWGLYVAASCWRW